MSDLNLNNLSERKLTFGYWFVTNKLFFKKLLVIFLIVFSSALVIFNGYSLVVNLAVRANDYQQALLSFVNINPDLVAFRQQGLPKAIQVGAPQIFANLDTSDVLADITNPNNTWWATFDYEFRLGEKLSDKRSSFILPGETKKIASLGILNGTQVTEFLITNVKWTKEIDYINLYNNRYKISVENVQYISASELDLGDNVPISRVSFDVINDSAYSYKNVDFLLFLYAGDEVMAVNTLNSGQLLSGQTKKLETNFIQKLPRITSVDVIVELNILNEDNIIK